MRSRFCTCGRRRDKRFDERAQENKDERGGACVCACGLVGSGIDIFVRVRERERAKESVSRFYVSLLPTGPAFSSAVWSTSSFFPMPSLKIEVVCMPGCREAQAIVVTI